MALRRRLMLISPVHSISISVCLLLVPPGPGSDFTDEAPDEDDEDDKEEAGLSPTSSRGPIFRLSIFDNV